MDELNPFEEREPNTGKKYWLPFMVYPQRLNEVFRATYRPYLISLEFIFHFATIVAYLHAILTFTRGQSHINTKIVVNLGFITSIIYILLRFPLLLIELDFIPVSGPTDEWIVKITTWRLFFFDVMFFFQINILIERAVSRLFGDSYKCIVSNAVIVAILVTNGFTAFYCCKCKVDGDILPSTYIFIVVGCNIVSYMVFLVINQFAIKEAQNAYREAVFLEKKNIKKYIALKKRTNYAFGVSTIAISIVLLSFVIPTFYLEDANSEQLEFAKFGFNLFCSFFFGFAVTVMTRFMKGYGFLFILQSTTRVWPSDDPSTHYSLSYISANRAMTDLETSWAQAHRRNTEPTTMYP